MAVAAVAAVAARIKKDDAGPVEKSEMVPIKASYRKGGKVKHTGPAKLHKGERVLTAKQARKYEKRKRGSKR